MNTYSEKTNHNKSHSLINKVSQKEVGSTPTVPFVDNRSAAIAQRKRQEMLDYSPQAKQAGQLQAMADNYSAQQYKPIQKKENKTGLPDNLKSGIENLSGYSMDDVKVHHNSSQPAQLNALAFAQGNDIHLGAGQEKHLPHEAWHVVQQKQGRVMPTMQMKDKVNINDDDGLEKEADLLGEKALTAGQGDETFIKTKDLQTSQITVQRKRSKDDGITKEDFSKNYRGNEKKVGDTVDVAEANYQKSLTSGRDKMNEAVKWFTNASDKKAQIETYGGTYQSVLDAGYKVFWFFPDEESVTICMTRGTIRKRNSDVSGSDNEHDSGSGSDNEYDSGEESENDNENKKGEIVILESQEVSGYAHSDVFEEDQDYLYANTFNVKTGEFHASINFRDLDTKLANKENLPPALSNSEIIWFMQSHAKEVYRLKYPEVGELSAVTSISREEIGNTQTLDTIFMADENREAFEGDTVTLTEPTDEAIAILGTPNGNSSLWMLIQHEKSGTVDIESLEFESDHIKINYIRDDVQTD
ncbi:MAG: DUF4157 domain-containing protein [Sporocytophaga sp.]|uniref:eCIS core domain-containing protein n=1 Tax=Sporocytophaga sp. TaxID=2231183 RepID=UPI001B2529CC|nr:DUF4157 domain-containing protein [Sporocytophaga sp.]MBO9701969.1 DUF4157 domain-containing protein [Sporocytophaga sp.]